MTKEDYIERLKRAKKILDSVKEDLNRSIDCQEYNMKQQSSLAALAARETMEMLTEEIFKLATSKIEN